MNQTQKNYIRKRVEGMLQTKISDARVKLTVKAERLTNRQRVRMIQDGEVKMKPKRELDNINGIYGANLDTVFDFSKYETKGGLDNTAYQAGIKKLRAKANSINDKVMLGDSEEALKLIEEFESFDY